ncbi:hypothetical protein I5Q06_01910 [Serratia ureilytica]|uniref:hypothetical protein n=2 Tax=Serratia TaxID=613 RepID=UPI0018DA0C4D|nr:hypothetical protein [Serratia ureilytica]MBH3318125.1 hypothetical protein [Serratia ureilytica]
MINVGDEVTTKFNKGEWGVIVKIGGLPEFPNIDIDYGNGQILTGIPVAAIDQHSPKNEDLDDPEDDE